jgi:predicted RNA-binding protein with PUA-like domain
MPIWLLKTEPTVYSYADLEKDGQTMWDGVTNALALQNLRKIVAGDTALIYHTGDEKRWVGIAEVVRGYYVNPDFDDQKLAVCDVKASHRLEHPVTLAAVKACEELAQWDLVRNSRLSVVPVSEAQYSLICRLAQL